MLDLQTKLCAHEQAEATRQAQRIAASKKAAETAAARAQARREAEAIERENSRKPKEKWYKEKRAKISAMRKEFKIPETKGLPK